MLIASSSLELLKVIFSNNISEFIKLTPPYNIKSFNLGEDKFLKPAAVALGYGLLFATVLILLLVPAIYYIREDLIAYFKHPFSESQPKENT